MSKVDRIIIRAIYEQLRKGNKPKFGSPETKCNKCMFNEVICIPNKAITGCLGGWKREV
ncbi:MAG: hypothetical protein Q4F78_07325 [Bacillota bacterium]|nr:hypothetical protein [Bacillota bacterium]